MKNNTKSFNIQNPVGTMCSFIVGESILASWTEYPARRGKVKLHGFKKPLELHQVDVLGGRIFD